MTGRYKPSSRRTHQSPVARRSADDPYCWLVDLEAVLAETQRMLVGTSPLVQWRARVLKEIEDVLSL